MVRALLAVLLIVPLALAGCLGGSDETVDQQSAPVAPASDESGRLTQVGLDLPNGTPEEDEPAPTLATAPAWRLGEWWRVRLTDAFTGQTYEATRVVAGTENDEFLVGMPADVFSNELMVLHIPGFGQVAREDLSFEIHDARFNPLRFPLTEGASWETAFEERPVTATVTGVDGVRADVELLGDNDHITLTYDAAARQIVKFTADGYATYEMVEHGFGHRGLVTVPHMHDVIFQHGRIVGAANTALEPAPPTDTVTVDATYDRVSFVIILGNVLAEAPGLYQETVTAPDGTTYELTKMPDEPPGFKLRFYMHDAPGGDWNFQHVAAGPGIAMAEGIAYHVYDVELPSGRILPSTGEHDHGG